ncbi:MAG: ATP-binding protein, partial [Proteobacteria bacterium]|nr:ATP-binding protein [Pseudomonadota bacterium]
AADGLRFVLLDEVSYIKNWDKGVKFLADSGQLESVVLVLTGSDTAFIKEARMRFPGRRGRADEQDFHLYPLSFTEFLRLKHRFSESELVRLTRENERLTDGTLDLLFAEFGNYLVHGGYLTAINDMAMHGRISNSTLNTYSDWIRGDFLKKGKQENYLRQIIRAIITRYGSQVTWNNLLTDLTIDHPKTVSDYVSLLETMDAAFIQSALVEDKLMAAPKKAKKLVFTDPFIFHALNNWIAPAKESFDQVITPFMSDPVNVSKLVEACVVTHFRRYYETMYIKSGGEVDIAYIDRKKFWPVEIKWTTQIRQKDLKQIKKYPNGRILAKTKHFSDLDGV